MKFIQADENWQDRWNEYVSQHVNATPYHQWGWCESVRQAYGFLSQMFVAIDSTDKVIGVLPVSIIKTPIAGRKGSALPYCDAGGVLADNDEIKLALVKHVSAALNDERIAKFEHREALNEAPEDLALAEKVRMVLSLPDTSETLLAGFKSKLRSQIRKAEKNGLTSDVGNSQEHIDGFYQVYTRNMRDLGSPAHSKKWFESILREYDKDAIIANVYKDDVVVGAGLVLFNGGTCSIPWASTNADYNRLAPNMLLYWTLLEFATDAEAQFFDFGRSTPGEGTYKFKAQWGAEPKALNWQLWVAGELQQEPVEVEPSQQNAKSDKQSMRQRVENVWRKLPVPLATFIGSNVRKYISL